MLSKFPVPKESYFQVQLNYTYGVVLTKTEYDNNFPGYYEKGLAEKIG